MFQGLRPWRPMRQPNQESQSSMKINRLFFTIVAVCSLSFAVNPAFVRGQEFSSTTYTVPGQPACIALADVNGDGKLDLITANSALNTVTVLRSEEHTLNSSHLGISYA